MVWNQDGDGWILPARIGTKAGTGEVLKGFDQ